MTESEKWAVAMEDVVFGLQLALTAPNEDMSEDFTHITEAIAQEYLTLGEFDQAKDEALAGLGVFVSEVKKGGGIKKLKKLYARYEAIEVAS